MGEFTTPRRSPFSQRARASLWFSTISIFRRYAAAGWLPSGQDIVFVGSSNGPGAGLRLYVKNLAGKPRPFSPTRISADYGQWLTSPGGKTAVVLGPDGRPTLYPLDGGMPVRLPSTEPGDLPMHWTPDGKYLFYSHIPES